MAKSTKRFSRPGIIPRAFWRTLKDWQKPVVAVLAENLNEEFTVSQIKQHTGLERLLSARIDPLRVRFYHEVPGYVLNTRAVELPKYAVFWKMARE